MKKIFLVLSLVFFAACAADANGGGATPTAENQNGDDLVNIGIIQLSEHPALDASRYGFIQAIEDEGFNVNFDFQNAQGDTATLSTISQRFVNNNVDLVLAVATPAAQSIAAETQTIPIVASTITSFEAAGLVQSNESPGFNVTGTSSLSPVSEQINMMIEFMPEIETIGILFSSNEPNSVHLAGLAREYIAYLGLNYDEGTVTNINDVQQVTTAVANRVDAIFIPLDNTFATAFALVHQISIDTNTPIFSADTLLTLEGGVATLGISFFDLGYQAGIMAAQILRGEAEPSTMPVQWSQNFNYVINGNTIEHFGLTVPERFLEYVQFPE